MNRVTNLLVLIVLTISCNQKRNIESNNSILEEGNKPLKINTDSIVLQYFESIEIYNPIILSEKQNEDSILELAIEGENVVLIGRPSSEIAYRKYDIVGLNEKIGFYIVNCHFWEHYESYLIDQISGRIDTLWTEPIFSRNDSIAVCKSMDYGLESIPNGFQVWKLNMDRVWEKIMEVDQNSWVPIEIKWVNSNEFIVKKIQITHFLQSKKGQEYYEFEKFEISSIDTR